MVGHDHESTVGASEGRMVVLRSHLLTRSERSAWTRAPAPRQSRQTQRSLHPRRLSHHLRTLRRRTLPHICPATSFPKLPTSDCSTRSFSSIVFSSSSVRAGVEVVRGRVRVVSCSSVVLTMSSTTSDSLMVGYDLGHLTVLPLAAESLPSHVT